MAVSRMDLLDYRCVDILPTVMYLPFYYYASGCRIALLKRERCTKLGYELHISINGYKYEVLSSLNCFSTLRNHQSITSIIF